MTDIEIGKIILQLGLMALAFYGGFSQASKWITEKYNKLLDNRVEEEVNKYIRENNLKHIHGISEVTYPYGEGGEIKGYIMTCTKRQHFFTSLLLPDGQNVTFGTFNGQEIRDLFSMERADQVLEQDLLERWNKESYDVD